LLRTGWGRLHMTKYNGLVAARYLEWLQSLFTILVNLFECIAYGIGLWTNVAKTEVSHLQMYHANVLFGAPNQEGQTLDV
jgi:hypothetical protein